MLNVNNTGLSISIYRPKIDPILPLYTPTGQEVVHGIHNHIDSYSHRINALGGFDRCTFKIAGPLRYIEDWIDRIGYHVEVRNRELAIAWEGFINRITLNIGNLTLEAGSFIDIANRVKCVYSSIEYADETPVLGLRKSTDFANDDDSQSRFGIIERVLSVGGATDETANQIRDLWLAENSYSKLFQSYMLGAGDTSVTVECLGYYHFLDLYIYNDTTSGEIALSDAVKNVLDANPNALFSKSVLYIDTNELTTSRYENDNDTALKYIKYLVSQGGQGSKRFLFGIYEGLSVRYNEQPSKVEYYQEVTSNRQDVKTASGQIVPPWDVRPGKWLLYSDLFVTAPSTNDLLRNPRAEFIESVTFNAPYSLSHTGSKTSTLAQKLARLGLGGVG